MAPPDRHAEVLEFWFGPAPEVTSAYLEPRTALWFGGAPETDAGIRARFGDLVAAAARGELAAWEADARRCLALVVLLDQLSLNLHRDDRRGFDQSAQAIPIALRALERGFDRQVTPPERMFFYMPLEHAEDLPLQRRSVACFQALLDELPPAERALMADFHRYAVLHLEVVERFGRFPDRNPFYARPDTPEEAEYMAQGGPPF